MLDAQSVATQLASQLLAALVKVPASYTGQFLKKVLERGKHDFTGEERAAAGEAQAVTG